MEFIFTVLPQNLKIKICKFFLTVTNRKNKFHEISLKWLNAKVYSTKKTLFFLDFSKILIEIVFLPSYYGIFLIFLFVFNYSTCKITRKIIDCSVCHKFKKSKGPESIELTSFKIYVFQTNIILDLLKLHHLDTKIKSANFSWDGPIGFVKFEALNLKNKFGKNFCCKDFLPLR